MPNYNGVWSLSTQYQYATTWQNDHLPPTRALFAGGPSSDVIEFVQVETTGNSTDFGNLLAADDNKIASC